MMPRHLIAIVLVLPLMSCSPPAQEKDADQARSATAPEAVPIAVTAEPVPRLISASPAPRSEPTAADADATFKQAELALKNRDLDGALKKVEEALVADRKHRGALLLLVAILQDQGQLAGSLQQVRQRNESFLKSATVARRLREAHPNLNPGEKAMLATALYNEACALTLANDTDKAIRSLNEALDAGFQNTKLLETDPDLASIRGKSSFRDLQKRTEHLNKARLRAWAKQLLAEQKPFEFTFRRPDVSSTKLLSLSDFKGKVVIVDLWATWCPPCREEVKQLVKLHKAYRGAGLEIVGLNFEGTPFKEAKTTVKKFAKEYGITYTCLLGDEKTRDQVPNFIAYPTLLFLDRTGRVRLLRLGLHPYELLEPIVTTLLEEPGTTVAKK
jgi:thiol-disulfide isomerase/thioredoxin